MIKSFQTLVAVLLLFQNIAKAEPVSESFPSTYVLKNGTTCVDCRIIDKQWGATLFKPTLKFYYDRLLTQAAAGGEHFILEKPDRTQLKVSIRQLKQEQIQPTAPSLQYNISTFSGERLKGASKILVDYPGKYFIFQSADGEKFTLPFQEVEYIAATSTGQLLFNGAEIKEKVAQLARTSLQLNAAALNLQSNLNQQRALNIQEQALRQSTVLNQARLPQPANIYQSPTTIHCNTLGTATTCTGW